MRRASSPCHHALLSRASDKPACPALIMPARAFSAWLEPVTPPLRNARRDTGLPNAANLRATGGPAQAVPVRAADQVPWSHGCGVVLARDRAGPASRTVPGQPPVLCGLVRPGPPRTRTETAGSAGCPVRLSGVSVASASARSMCASAVPMARTRTGRQDTTVVTAHGARVIPAWAIRW